MHMFFIFMLVMAVDKPLRFMPWLRALDAGLSSWMPEFYHRLFHVGMVVDKVALGQVSSE
jgi:hypothetical protein